MLFSAEPAFVSLFTDVPPPFLREGTSVHRLAFVGRDEKRASLKTPAWEARVV